MKTVDTVNRRWGRGTLICSLRLLSTLVDEADKTIRQVYDFMGGHSARQGLIEYIESASNSML